MSQVRTFEIRPPMLSNEYQRELQSGLVLVLILKNLWCFQKAVKSSLEKFGALVSKVSS